MNAKDKILSLAVAAGCITSKSAQRFSGISFSKSKQFIADLRQQNDLQIIGQIGASKLYAPTEKHLAELGIDFRKTDFGSSYGYFIDSALSVYPDLQFINDEDEYKQQLTSLGLTYNSADYPKRYVLAKDILTDEIYLFVRLKFKEKVQQNLLQKLFTFKGVIHTLFVVSLQQRDHRILREVKNYVAERDSINDTYDGWLQGGKELPHAEKRHVFIWLDGMKNKEWKGFPRNDKNMQIVGMKGNEYSQLYPKK